jgi:hypothetical protein
MSREELLSWAETNLNIFLDVNEERAALLGRLLRLSV